MIERNPRAIGTPGDPDYLDHGKWWENKRGSCLERGFVGNSRFAVAGEQVIKRTSGDMKRRNRSAK